MLVTRVSVKRVVSIRSQLIQISKVTTDVASLFPASRLTLDQSPKAGRLVDLPVGDQQGSYQPKVSYKKSKHIAKTAKQLEFG